MAIVIIEGIFIFQTKYVLQCEQMVPVLLFLLCFMFIATNLRLAGGYHLPSAVDVVFGGEKKVSNISLYILFSLGKKHGDKKYEQLKDQEQQDSPSHKIDKFP